MTRKIRINPALFAVFCFFTSVSLALGAVDDWGRLSTGFGNLKTFFVESLWPPIGVSSNRDSTLNATHLSDSQSLALQPGSACQRR